MPSVQQFFGWPNGRRSYTANSAILGGQLVEQIPGTDLVQPAGAGSVLVVGVAAFDVPVARVTAQGPQVGDGHELLVFESGTVGGLLAAAAIVEGQRLMAAASGAVTPWVAAGDPRTIIGTAYEAIANAARGRVRIKPVGV